MPNTAKSTRRLLPQRHRVSLVDLKAAQTELHSAVDAMATASHALVNALTSLKGSADLIVERLTRAAEQLGG